ncbi:hypothetical protein LMG29542_08191 [Paraburkholderia humisilvae]|uniref:Transposase n=1 Tax=Paraburkholderia humisilvae TaxID=627669 RepID=A0A6J5F7M9_9BURK|nr:hypothetical protein LMG29542_08191 [Paraburkholderia humisilvae]
MTKRSRRSHNPAFKAKVALAALKGDKTLDSFNTVSVNGAVAYSTH